MSMIDTSKLKSDEHGEYVLPELFVRHPSSRLRITANIVGESLTSQSDLESTDVNNVVRQYTDTGFLPPGKGEGQFADVTALQGDLTERINYANDVYAQAMAESREFHAKRMADEAAEKQRLDAELAEFRKSKQVDSQPTE